MWYRLSTFAVFAIALYAVSDNAQAQKGGKSELGSIEVFKNKAGEYRYRVKDGDGKTIAIPLANMSWEKKADALKAIDQLKSILNTAKPVDVKDEEPAPKKDKKKTAA